MDRVNNFFHLVLFGVLYVGEVCATSCNYDLEIVPRDEWGARPPTLVEPMANPVPYVVIHHSYKPEACYSKEECIDAMQWIQDYHQFNHSWNDIGYSFLAGGDNRIYTGRGWSAVGAHAPGYNNQSIGICVIGDWTVELPPEGQLEVVKRLIKKGIKDGYIQENYKLIGHRQVRDTECPGDALYNEIQKWSHYVANPSENVSDDNLFDETPSSNQREENDRPDPSEECLKPDPREEVDRPCSIEDVDLPDEHNKLNRQTFDS